MRTLGARRGRHKDTIGRVREKLSALLRAEGFDIEPIDLRWSDGQNSHVTEDCFRWDAYVKTATRDDCPDVPPGCKVFLYSWDSMTLCARKGIIVDKDRDIAWSYQIHARED
jgi:hypothetical protein